MKRYIFSLSILFIPLAIFAQSTLSLGVRGGVDLLMPKSEHPVYSKCGGTGMFDIGYTYYWQTRKSGEWGIHTGVSVGYIYDKTHLDFTQHFTNYDYLNNEMRYTISGNVDLALQRVAVEFPAMAAFRYKGFVLQCGFKLQLAIISHTVQKLNNPFIEAYYVPYDVPVTDKLITGIVPYYDLVMHYSYGAPLANFLLAMRIGYEAKVGKSGRFGIAAYLDYNAWNGSSRYSNAPLINVAPITNTTYPVPSVHINNAYTSVIAIHPLQVGLSLYYAIEFEPYRSRYGYRKKIR